MEQEVEHKNADIRMGKAGKTALAVLIALVLIFFVLCFLLIREYRSLRANEAIPEHPFRSGLLHHAGPALPSDANYIQSWMTFSYINYIFKVSPDYLKSALAITDSRYPHVSVSEYSDDSHLSATTTVVKVRQAVSAYITEHQ